MSEKTQIELIEDIVTGTALIQAALDGLIEATERDVNNKGSPGWSIHHKARRFRQHYLREALGLAADLKLTPSTERGE